MAVGHLDRGAHQPGELEDAHTGGERLRRERVPERKGPRLRRPAASRAGYHSRIRQLSRSMWPPADYSLESARKSVDFACDVTLTTMTKAAAPALVGGHRAWRMYPPWSKRCGRVREPIRRSPTDEDQ
jgi:hypothetical protein